MGMRIYSLVPVVRVHNSKIPWLKSAKPFPKQLGMQVFVYTRDHLPAHIHVEFLDGKSVRLEWPGLTPLRGDPALSGREERDVATYVKTYQPEILGKLRKAFGQPNLPAAF